MNCEADHFNRTAAGSTDRRRKRFFLFFSVFFCFFLEFLSAIHFIMFFFNSLYCPLLGVRPGSYPPFHHAPLLLAAHCFFPGIV